MHRHAVRILSRSFATARPPAMRAGAFRSAAAAAAGGVGAGAAAGGGAAPAFAGFAAAVSSGVGGPMCSIATCGPKAAAGRFRVNAVSSAFSVADLAEVQTVLDDT